MCYVGPMRIAVLSDIHANRAAMDAVLVAVSSERPDHVVVAGDVINRGPDPRACLDAVLARRKTDGWMLLKGNHEDFILQEAARTTDQQPWEQQLYAHTRWTLHRVHERLAEIAAWPDRLSLEGPDGSEVRFVHASMRGNRQGLYEHMEAPLLAELAAPPPAVLVAGHTHIPFVRAIDGTLIVNAGAVGMPFDGIADASFALLEWRAGRWNARIHRVAYDRERARRAFVDKGYLAEGGPMVRLILDELEHARPRLNLWHRHYEARVAAGELSIEESVESLLRGLMASASAPG